MIVSAHGHLFTSLFFFGFIALSLGLTWWSMRRARDATGFFVAGRCLTGWQNGLAISGDYMSAASFLGIAGLVSLFGFDGLLYSFGFIVGWVVIVLLVAEPLRNSGKYTLSDVMAFRLRARPVRAAAAVSSVTIGLFYLLAQLVRRDYEMRANNGLWKLPVAMISNGNTVKNTEYSFLANILAARGYLLASGVRQTYCSCSTTCRSGSPMPTPIT
jgi:hypothetical protein